MSRASLRQSLRMVLPLLSLLGVLALIIMACGGSSANAGTTVATSGSNTSSSNSSKHFKVGDQVKVGNTFIVTINSFKTSKGGEFDKPKSGNVFVVVDVSIKNVSSKEQALSSLLQFTLKDATGQKYTETFITGATPPDGKLAAGDVVKGQMPYEVPSSQHDFTLAFEADIISGGQTIWDLHV